MKRHVIAAVVGSLFAIPAAADFETGLPLGAMPAGASAQVHAATKSRNAVHDEMISAQDAEQTVLNAELGRTAEQYSGMRAPAVKTRAEVVSEVRQARRSGDYVVNAELGTKASQL